MRTSYEQDFALWTDEQARLLQEGRWSELDAAHIAEELEALGRSDRRALESQIERVLMHLLKWRHQPNRRTRSWRLSILDGRRKIAKRLEESPSLKTLVQSQIDDGYRYVRLFAAEETGLPIATFPEACPFTIDEILNDAGMGERPEDEGDPLS